MQSLNFALFHVFCGNTSCRSYCLVNGGYLFLKVSTFFCQTTLVILQLRNVDTRLLHFPTELVNHWHITPLITQSSEVMRITQRPSREIRRHWQVRHDGSFTASTLIQLSIGPPGKCKWLLSVTSPRLRHYCLCRGPLPRGPQPLPQFPPYAYLRAGASTTAADGRLECWCGLENRNV